MDTCPPATSYSVEGKGESPVGIHVCEVGEKVE